ncbi:MAG TPA: glycosyltransferase [Gemmatimonadales bacterium]|nr:glycosyltransferase [Gemmatimonadales bacterium]
MTFWIALALGSALLLLIPWALYPWIAIRLAAARGAEPGRNERAQENVSVVLATREPPEAVRARLADLLAGTWPASRIDLVVGVDGDAEPYRFADLVPAPHRLVVVAGAAPGGKASALNAAMGAVTTGLVVCTDTQQRFAPDAIARLVEALDDPRFGAVSGALRLGNEAIPESLLGRYWSAERRLRAAEARLHSTVGVSGSIYAMRRSLWAPLPAGLILDDLWIPMQLVLAGHRVGFEPGAEASDIRTTTSGQEFERKVRTLTGNLQLIAWMPAVLLPWRNPVWIQFVCHKLLRLATPYALAGLGLGVLGAAFSARPAMGWALLAALLLPGFVALVWRNGLGGRLRHGLEWVLSMQGAILVATWHGIRGEWNVWKR